MFEKLSHEEKNAAYHALKRREHLNKEPNYGNKLARKAVKGRIGVCHK